MAATLLGTVGIWGITSSESNKGFIVEEINDDTKNETAPIRDHQGERVGRVDYDESLDITVKGEFTSTSGYSGKISAALVINNTIAGTHLQSSTSGQTLVNSVSRTRKRDAWQGLEIKAELLPNYPAAAS